MKKTLIFIITLILFISCKKEDAKPVKKVKKKEEITLIFPDMVYINEGYDGKIDYKNRFDTITAIFDDVKKARFLEYAFLITKDKNYSMDYLKTIVKDTFVTKDNRMIPLYNIKFDKLGLNYFDGIITDEVMIENGGKLKDGKQGTRIITDEIRLTRGVYVIEGPKK